jgi:hypothetical protein
MIFPEFTNYLQMSPGSVSYVFLVLAKWGLNEAYTTHIGPSNRSLFLHKAPSVKSRSHSPHYFIKKMLLKSISSVISVVVRTDICVFCFSILVSVVPQKCSLVWYVSKRGVAHKLILHSRHLDFVLVSLCLAEHTRHQILIHSYKPLSAVTCAKSV